jgi:hypothetical protein
MTVSPSPHRPGNTPARVSRGGPVLIPTHGSPGVPHSVWLPPKSAVTSPAVAGSALPAWALERACAQFAPAGGPAAVLLPPGPGYTERTAHPTGAAPGWLSAAQPVELADAGRARLALALVLADPTPGAVTDPQHMAGFFAEIRAALRPGALLLVHTHPVHTKAGMHDPAGDLLRAARAAGFAYLQHLVLVHHTPTSRVPARTARRSPARPGPVHRRVHSDLYALIDANGAAR